MKDYITRFIFINTLVYIHGFLNYDSIFPKEEVIAITILFLIILFIQIILIFQVKKFTFFTTSIFSIGNLYFFNIVLNGEDKVTNLLYLLTFFLLNTYLQNVKTKVIPIVFFCCFLSIELIKYFYYINSSTSKYLPSISLTVKGNYHKRSLFLIGIDGMISSKMYFDIYQENSTATEKLEKLGFKSIDINSPGISTLETYSKLITYKNKIHPRQFIQNITSKNSSYYRECKSLGYKMQFTFSSNYFGGNSNKIFDSYFPNQKTPFSFIYLIDDRWGWYTCKFLKKYFATEANTFEVESQIHSIENQIEQLSLTNNKWISISHLWFPGHTLGSYNYDNKNEFKRFRKYYKDSQKKLASFFENVTNQILKKDANAIIIFWGDHGSYIFKSSNNKIINRDTLIDSNLIERDKREVLFSVYPKYLIDDYFVEKIKNNPELLFRMLLYTR